MEILNVPRACLLGLFMGGVAGCAPWVTIPTHCASWNDEGLGNLSCGGSTPWCSSCTGKNDGCVTGEPVEKCKPYGGEHCLNQDPRGLIGGAFCAAVDPGVPWCSRCEREGNGCVSEPPEEECWADDVWGSSTGDDSSGDSGDDTSGSAGDDGTTDATGSTSSGGESTDDASEGDESGTGTGTGTGTGADDGSTETGDAPECTVEDGMFAGDECAEPSKVFCHAGECVGCLGTLSTACEVYDVSAPACDDELGQCVECTGDDAVACGGDKGVCESESRTCVQCTPEDSGACMGATPICSDAFECVPCSEHGECPSGACALDTGECFPIDSQRWVNKDDENSSDEGYGLQDVPFRTIGAAILKVEASGYGVVRVIGGGVYAENVVIDEGRSVALFGGMAKVVGASDLISSVSVVGGSRGYIKNVEIDGGAEGGVWCKDSVLYLDLVDINGVAGSGVGCKSSSLRLNEVRVDSNGDNGVDIDDCDVEIRESLIFDNAKDGVVVSGTSSVSIGNSVIAKNGDDETDTRGVNILDATAVFDIRYSTIVANDGSVASSLQCAFASGLITDSILAAGVGGSIACPGASISFSVVDTEGFVGEGLELLGYDTAWFVSSSERNYHLSPDGSAALSDVAQWNAGDPLTDFDGESRSGVEGAMGYPGAFEP